MARMIYFPDGTHEVLLGEDNERTELERIIRERLGRMLRSYTVRSSMPILVWRTS